MLISPDIYLKNSVWVAKSCTTVCFTYSLRIAIFWSHISQCSVAICLGYVGVFKHNFITDFLLSLTVKEFWESVNIWWSYGQEFGLLFFLTHISVQLYLLRWHVGACVTWRRRGRWWLGAADRRRLSVELTTGPVCNRSWTSSDVVMTSRLPPVSRSPNSLDISNKHAKISRSVMNCVGYSSNTKLRQSIYR